MTEEEIKHIAYLAAQATLRTYFRHPEGFNQDYFNNRTQSGPAILDEVYQALAPMLLTNGGMSGV